MDNEHGALAPAARGKSLPTGRLRACLAALLFLGPLSGGVTLLAAAGLMFADAFGQWGVLARGERGRIGAAMVVLAIAMVVTALTSYWAYLLDMTALFVVCIAYYAIWISVSLKWIGK